MENHLYITIGICIYCFPLLYVMNICSLYLARQNVAKSWESVIKSFVVNALVQVFDEHVSNSRFSQRGITLRPHDPDRTTLDGIKVHGVHGTLSWNKKKKVICWKQKTFAEIWSSNQKLNPYLHACGKDFYMGWQWQNQSIYFSIQTSHFIHRPVSGKWENCLKIFRPKSCCVLCRGCPTIKILIETFIDI